MKHTNKNQQIIIHEWLFLAVVFALITSEVLYIPRADIFIGWDTAPHAYLVTRMNDLLSHFQVRGIDENWFLGIPLFYLYPPLAFVFALVPKFILLNHLSPIESFNIFLFLIPFLIFLTSYFAGRKIAGTYGGRVSGLVSLFYLFLPSSLEHQGVGLHAFINLGLFASAIALCFLTLLLAELVTTYRWWWCGILLSFILLTHQLTSIFAFLFIGLYSLSSRERFIRGVVSAMTGLILTSWWWIPCILNLDQSSGRALSVSTDPLLMLFPEISKDFFLSVRNAFSRGELLQCVGCIPWISIVSFLILFSFCATLHRSKMHSFLIVSLILFCTLPRNFFFQLLSIHLHYYRFTVCFLSSMVVFSAVGFSHWIGNKKYQEISIVFLLTGAFCLSLVRFDLRVGNFFDIHSLRTGRLIEYPAGNEAEQVLSIFKGASISGRVIEEYLPSNGVTLGTPHLFSTLLPLYAHTPVATGLLLESSMCGEFLYEVMYGLSREEGRMNFWIPPEDVFHKNTTEDFINKLTQFGVKYIISYSPQLTENLMKSVQANQVFKGRWMSVFEVFARVGESVHRIYIEPSSIDAKAIARELFRDPYLSREIFIQGEEVFNDLSENQKNSFDAVLKVENFPVSKTTRSKVRDESNILRIRSALMRDNGDSTYLEIPSIFSSLGKIALTKSLMALPINDRREVSNLRSASRILNSNSMTRIPCFQDLGG